MYDLMKLGAAEESKQPCADTILDNTRTTEKLGKPQTGQTRVEIIKRIFVFILK